MLGVQRDNDLKELYSGCRVHVSIIRDVSKLGKIAAGMKSRSKNSYLAEEHPERPVYSAKG